jgi:hypothetical protein
MYIIGKVKVKPKIQRTSYCWGPASEIEGKELKLIEINPQGDCLCLAPGSKGIVDVHSADVESVTFFPSPTETIQRMFQGMKSE